MEGHAFKVPRDALVIQAVDKLFSRQSLTGCDRHSNPVRRNGLAEAARLRGHVVELLRLLPGEVLLVTYKAVEEVIMAELPAHVHVKHFGNVRGLNAHEHCETVVILGREQPSAPAIEVQARPFTATDAEPFIPFGEYVAQSRGRRQRQDGPNVAVVPVHPDLRCQAMLEQVREAEIVQALDRVRPVFNRRTVILLTDLPVDVTVDRVVHWRALRPNNLVVAFARHGVLPLVPSDMARCFPDIWGSINTAKSCLTRSGFKGCISQIDNQFGVCTSLIPDLALATYRRHGQRGYPGRAVLYAGLPNPKASLEALVGKLVEFALDVIEMADASDPHPGQSKRGWSLPPVAAALAAEAHNLATSDPTERPPDMLGFAGVRRLMAAAAWGRHQAKAA